MDEEINIGDISISSDNEINVGDIGTQENEIVVPSMNIPALKGEKGDNGRGISSVAKTSTVGLVDTWTITYTDGSTSIFQVTNGEDGDDYVITQSDYQEIADIVESDITIPTKLSELQNDEGFIDNTVNDLQNYTKTSDLADVATSGSYNDLSNTPSIPSKTSDLTNDSGFIDNTYHDSTKQDALTAGDNITIENNVISATGGGSSDYSNLTNKPSINSVTLSGNKTTSDLGLGTITSVKMNGSTISSSGEANLGTVITDVSDKQNITDNSLTTTNKTIPTAINEVNSIAKGANQALSYSNYSAMITEFNSLDDDAYGVGQNIYIVTTEVPDLWISNIESTSSTYTYVDDDTVINDLETNGYIQVGYYKLSALETQKVDLTDYVKNTDYATSSTAGVIRVGTAFATYLNTDNRLASSTKTFQEYSGGNNAMFISKGTLENVITGKNLYSKSSTGIPKTDLDSSVQTSLGKADTALQEHQDLSDYVTNTDYASLNTGGVVRVNPSYGINTASTGTLIGVTKDYSNYSSASDLSIITKGTLENVVTGKGLITNTDYADSDTGGVIKIGSSYGTAKASSGHLVASVKTYEDYSSAGNYMLVGKGTLENVIEGKGLATKSDIPKVFYGTSATGASTATKAVVCGDFTEADLVAGTIITVLFTNGNTYNGQATLNINGTGDKNIYYNGTTTNSRYMWVAGESVEFIYNGTQWATINGGLATTTYYGVTKLYTGSGSDSQSFALTPRSLYYFANYSIAPYYSSSATYEVGDKVRYTYYLYECNTAIETAEAWNAEHWTQIATVQEQIDKIEEGKKYSTSEKVVGTWIDNRPLYQKTIVLENTTISSSTKEMTILDITNNDIVMVENMYINGDTSSTAGNRQKIFESFTDNNGHYVNVRGWQNNLLLQTDVLYYINKAYITVKYTKTTD